MADNVVDITKKIVTKAVDKLGLELIDVEFVLENKKRYLRVYIYKQNGVSMDDCTKVHHEVNKEIEESINYEKEYILEISSPGYNRALKSQADFDRYVGEIINIHLYAPIDGKKEYEGKLIGYNNGIITIVIEEEEFKCEVEKTSKIKRVFKIT